MAEINVDNVRFCDSGIMGPLARLYIKTGNESPKFLPIINMCDNRFTSREFVVAGYGDGDIYKVLFELVNNGIYNVDVLQKNLQVLQESQNLGKLLERLNRLNGRVNGLPSGAIYYKDDNGNLFPIGYTQQNLSGIKTFLGACFYEDAEFLKHFIELLRQVKELFAAGIYSPDFGRHNSGFKNSVTFIFDFGKEVPDQTTLDISFCVFNYVKEVVRYICHITEDADYAIDDIDASIITAVFTRLNLLDLPLVQKIIAYSRNVNDLEKSTEISLSIDDVIDLCDILCQSELVLTFI